MRSKPLLSWILQEWTEKANLIQCPALLPEEQAGPLLTKMLVPAPYKARKKKTEKEVKETRGGRRCRGTSKTVSEDSEARSSSKEDEEEEESNSPPDGGRKKRAASTRLEAKASKKGKASLPDNSIVATDSSSE